MGRELSLYAGNTMSKSIDDASAFLSAKADKNFPQGGLNYRAGRAVSSFDVHQRLAMAHVYRIPGGMSLARDAEFRGNLTAQTGQPFTPILRFDNSNTGNTGWIFASGRPNLVSNPRLAQRGPDQWFDTAAFALPAPYTFG